MMVHNYGLGGQVVEASEYDHFICFTKACKARKDEKRRLRNEKKELKNDERRAETERIRTETGAMAAVTAPALPPTVPPDQYLAPPMAPTPPPADNTMVIVLGVLGALVLIGGIAWYIRKKKISKPDLSNLNPQNL